MEVILLERVANLGKLGDKVSVKPGYMRNFLFPQKKAKPATAENLKAFEEQRADLEKAAAEILATAQSRADKVGALAIEIAHLAGDEGKLFGSITGTEVAEAVVAAGVELTKSEVRLPNGPLRELGDFEVLIHLHTDVNCVLNLKIVAEEK